MADFDPALGEDGERRLPTTTERSNGIGCGPLSLTLINGLFHRLEAEIGEVIGFAGLTPTDDRYTQLREAIEALIAAATGGGDTTNFILMSQARARLPIYPEFLSADGKINISSPAAGTIRIPGGVTFQHRGIFPIVTDETDFATTLSKTYHVRWSEANGYQMHDLSSGTYNPGSLPENDKSFDSDYDDMLMARVITNSSNVATITNLANKDKLFTKKSSNSAMTSDSGGNSASRTVAFEWNYSRTPEVLKSVTGAAYSPNGENASNTGNATHDHDLSMTESRNDRYGITMVALFDYRASVEVSVLGIA